MRVPRPTSPRRGVLLFLFWTVHGPFSLFLLEEKEKMGGAMNQPSLVAILPRPKGRKNPSPRQGGRQRSPLWNTSPLPLKSS